MAWNGLTDSRVFALDVRARGLFQRNDPAVLSGILRS
jgi:hypothetical protein